MLICLVLFFGGIRLNIVWQLLILCSGCVDMILIWLWLVFIIVLILVLLISLVSLLFLKFIVKCQLKYLCFLLIMLFRLVWLVMQCVSGGCVGGLVFQYRWQLISSFWFGCGFFFGFQNVMMLLKVLFMVGIFISCIEFLFYLFFGFIYRYGCFLQNMLLFW